MNLETEYGARLSSIDQLPSIFALDVEPQRWLVDGFIPYKSITLLTGAAGVGKTMLAVALGGSVVRGEPFLGRACLKKPVLFLDRENPLYVIKDRVKLLGIVDDPNLHFWGGWNESEPKTEDKIVQDFAKEKPLIVVDSLIAFHTGSEQDATETRKFMNGLRRLANKGATVIIIHHTGKSDKSQNYRGSSDIPGAVDAAYVVKASSKGLEELSIENFKMRMSESTKPINVKFNGKLFEACSDVFTQEAIKGIDLIKQALAVDPGILRTALVEKIVKGGLTRSRARELVDRCIGEKIVKVKKGGKGGGEKCFPPSESADGAHISLH